MKFNYKIVYSARRTLSVNISDRNDITVRCPYGAKNSLIEKFLEEKSGWIEKILRKNARKLAENEDILSYKSVFVYGKKLPLVIGRTNEITEDAVFVKKRSDIKKVYFKKFGEEFLQRVNEISRQTGLLPASVGIKSYKSRWGCCDAKNNVLFNYKLFMLPKEAQDYVIVHELCHTKAHNHSQKFWKLVGDVMPNYKAVKKQMEIYDFIITLY